MRGLDERIALAHARVAAIIDPTDIRADAGDVYQEAYGLGVRNYWDGDYSAPVMFADEPALLRAWEGGQGFAAECEEMNNCHDCQDASLPLCPHHG